MHMKHGCKLQHSQRWLNTYNQTGWSWNSHALRCKKVSLSHLDVIGSSQDTEISFTALSNLHNIATIMYVILKRYS